MYRFKGSTYCFSTDCLTHVTCGVNDDNAVVVTYGTFIDSEQFDTEDEYFEALGETEDLSVDFDKIADGPTDCVRIFWL